MLSIGKLVASAAEYYIGVAASGAEDYYAGRGEAPVAEAVRTAHDKAVAEIVHAEVLGQQPPIGPGYERTRSASPGGRRRLLHPCVCQLGDEHSAGLPVARHHAPEVPVPLACHDWDVGTEAGDNERLHLFADDVVRCSEPVRQLLGVEEIGPQPTDGRGDLQSVAVPEQGLGPLPDTVYVHHGRLDWQ